MLSANAKCEFGYPKRRVKSPSGPPAVQPAPALRSINYTVYFVVDGILQLAEIQLGSKRFQDVKRGP